MEALSSEQRKIISSKKITFEVSPYEMAFILEIRKHTFGRVTAVITDGIPLRIETNRSEMITDSPEFNSVVDSFLKQDAKGKN